MTIQSSVGDRGWRRGASVARRARWAAPVLLVAALSPAAAQQNNILDSRILAPYVPTPEAVVTVMLEMADIQENDVVYDLGSGDGRIVITAAQQFGATGVGIELDEKLAAATRQRVRQLGLEDKVKILAQDMLEADLSPATVVTLYLLSSSTALMRPKLESDLKSGARVVSHDNEIRGWQPAATREVAGAGRTHQLYLYVVGQHK